MQQEILLYSNAKYFLPDVSRVKFVFIAKPGYNNTGTDVLSNSQKIVNIVISTVWLFSLKIFIQILSEKRAK